MKTCSKCGYEKSRDCFYKGNNKDGLHAWCKICCRERNRSDYQENKSLHKERNAKWREVHKEYNRERNLEWMNLNQEKRRQYKRNYRLKNAETIREYRRKIYKKNMENPEFRLRENMRGRIRRCISKKSMSTSTKQLLGCSFEELKTHLESQFQENMTWENYGEWHVDHVKPIASFDLSDPIQMKGCFSYLNLQPLWASDNLAKSDKINWESRWK